MTVIPFPRQRADSFQGYNFDVQVWLEDDRWKYAVVQEFEKVSGDEFEWLATGEADTAEEAFHLAAEEVKKWFANV